MELKFLDCTLMFVTFTGGWNFNCTGNLWHSLFAFPYTPPHPLLFYCPLLAYFNNDCLLAVSIICSETGLICCITTGYISFQTDISPHTVDKLDKQDKFNIYEKLMKCPILWYFHIPHFFAVYQLERIKGKLLIAFHTSLQFFTCLALQPSSEEQLIAYCGLWNIEWEPELAAMIICNEAQKKARLLGTPLPFQCAFNY